MPLFEQSVSLSTFAGQAQQRIGRVGCGSGSARESLFEFFEENLNVFPVILPQPFQSKDEQFMHLKLHNGTIWRWNRPLIGSEDGVPHLRIEHRVMPSGPTGIDMIANVAFWVGAMMAALEGGEGAVLDIPFMTARENFYRAACTGLDTKIVWSDGAEHPISELILETLLPMARRGIEGQRSQRIGIRPLSRYHRSARGEGADRCTLDARLALFSRWKHAGSGWCLPDAPAEWSAGSRVAAVSEPC